ncbi:MAG: HU family DNA-binding protein [Alphaproteobacteria bacterium]|nr:HU family DNA-binding protein [Alphaproteobacteria bacterium]
MGKFELIDYVADAVKITKVDAQKVVESVLKAIKESLTKEEEVRFIGFGTFAIQKSTAREGRNPRTGEKIKIAASNRPVFRAGKELKDSVNKSQK